MRSRVVLCCFSRITPREGVDKRLQALFNVFALDPTDAMFKYKDQNSKDVSVE